jgi:HEAT repeat protein
VDTVVSFLVNELEQASDDLSAEIIQLVGLLGEPGMRALAEVVRTGRDVNAERATATLIERDGPDMSHLRDLISEASGITLERALRAIISNQDRQMPQIVTTVVADAGAHARRRVVALIEETGRTDLSPVLMRMLGDPSHDVCMAAVGAIAHLEVREAVPALCDMAEREAHFGEGARLREAAVRALGVLGEGSAVPSVCAVLAGRAFLSKLGSHRARIAAAEALAVLGGPDSREALERGRKSMHPAVRDACRRSLSVLLSREGDGRGAERVH